MGHPAQTFRLVKVRGGMELQGIAKSDRGTKYIVSSIVIATAPGERLVSKEQVALAVAEIFKSSE